MCLISLNILEDEIELMAQTIEYLQRGADHVTHLHPMKGTHFLRSQTILGYMLKFHFARYLVKYVVFFTPRIYSIFTWVS